MNKQIEGTTTTIDSFPYIAYIVYRLYHIYIASAADQFYTFCLGFLGLIFVLLFFFCFSLSKYQTNFCCTFVRFPLKKFSRSGLATLCSVVVVVVSAAAGGIIVVVGVM